MIAPVTITEVNEMMVSVALREWFGAERYARDYEYLDAQYGPKMRATLCALLNAASLSEVKP